MLTARGSVGYTVVSKEGKVAEVLTKCDVTGGSRLVSDLDWRNTLRRFVDQGNGTPNYWTCWSGLSRAKRFNADLISARLSYRSNTNMTNYGRRR